MHLFSDVSRTLRQPINLQHAGPVACKTNSRANRCSRLGCAGLRARSEACTAIAGSEAAAPVARHGVPHCSSEVSLKQSFLSDGGLQNSAQTGSVCLPPASQGHSLGAQPAGNNIVPVMVTGSTQAASVRHGSSHACSTGQVQQRVQEAASAAGCTQHVWLPNKQLWVPPSSNGSAPEAREGPAATTGSTAKLQRLYMAAAATRGRKKCMEDRHVLAALDPARGVQQAHGPVGLHQQVSVGAVFDGHAGYATAAYAAKHIPQLLHEALSGHPGRSDGGPRVPQKEVLSPGSALAASFHWFDRWWADARCDPSLTEHGWDDSGSTAVVGLVSGQQLVVANAGDSIAVLARGGMSQRLSVEHRLDNLAEAERVLEAGGRVVSFKPGAAPRVMGTSTQTRFKGSMVTRSLGDFAFKHPQALISADPHVTQHELCPSDKLVVLTSDGVTDVLTDDDMLEAAMRAIEQTQQCTNSGQALASSAATAIMNAALDAGSTDNITVVSMLLDWGCEYSAD